MALPYKSFCCPSPEGQLQLLADNTEHLTMSDHKSNMPFPKASHQDSDSTKWRIEPPKRSSKACEAIESVERLEIEEVEEHIQSDKTDAAMHTGTGSAPSFIPTIFPTFNASFNKSTWFHNRRCDKPADAPPICLFSDRSTFQDVGR